MMDRKEAAKVYRAARDKSGLDHEEFEHVCWMELSNDGEMFADGPVPGFKGFSPAAWASAARLVTSPSHPRYKKGA